MFTRLHLLAYLQGCCQKSLFTYEYIPEDNRSVWLRNVVVKVCGVWEVRDPLYRVNLTLATFLQPNTRSLFFFLFPRILLAIPFGCSDKLHVTACPLPYRISSMDEQLFHFRGMSLPSLPSPPKLNVNDGTHEAEILPHMATVPSG